MDFELGYLFISHGLFFFFTLRLAHCSLVWTLAEERPARSKQTFPATHLHTHTTTR